MFLLILESKTKEPSNRERRPINTGRIYTSGILTSSAVSKVRELRHRQLKRHHVAVIGYGHVGIEGQSLGGMTGARGGAGARSLDTNKDAASHGEGGGFVRKADVVDDDYPTVREFQRGKSCFGGPGRTACPRRLK